MQMGFRDFMAVLDAAEEDTSAKEDMDICMK
jgi:hypothetical protein